MKKIILRTIGIILLILLLAGGRLVWRGLNGFGSLNFLCYLMGPYELADMQYEISETAFEVTVDGETVRGKIFLPEDGAEERKAVIISHGFNCACNLLENKAKSLAASGVAGIVFDFRGGSHNGQSDGADTDMTVYTEMADLNAVADYVQSLGWVQDDGLYLMGESFGGFVTALTAPGRDDVSGIILCFPALHSPDSARENWSDVSEIPETLAVGDMTTGKEFWSTLWEMDVFADIAGYDGRVLILHGTVDPNVDYHYSIKANETYQNSELFLIEGAEHCFGGTNAETTLKTIYYFIEK